MSNYKAKITRDSEGRFFALVVRVDFDGQESVTNDYQCRHFKTEAAALRSTDRYIAKTNLTEAI